MEPKVGVVGGGINGVSTALAVLKTLPRCHLTVISDDFTPNTTGDGAAGIWGPYLIPGTSEEKINKWCKETWDLLTEWWREGRPGTRLYPVVRLTDKVENIPFWHHIPFAFHEMSQEEMKKYGSHYVFGYKYLAFTAEAPFVLPLLQDEIRALGAKIVQKKVRLLAGVADEYDLLINCTGIGAHSVTPDPKVYPVRGQLMRVNAPWQREAVFDDTDRTFAYVIPNTNSIVLGGTHQDHDWNTEVDPRDSDFIWNNCTNLLPQLKHCKILKEWVGLRPSRVGGVRLEVDHITTPSRRVPVIHNYGHGGSGLTLFWGCAQEAASLVARTVSKELGPISKL